MFKPVIYILDKKGNWGGTLCVQLLMQPMDHKPLKTQFSQLEISRQGWLSDETPSVGELMVPAAAMSSCCG